MNDNNVVITNHGMKWTTTRASLEFVLGNLKGDKDSLIKSYVEGMLRTAYLFTILSIEDGHPHERVFEQLKLMIEESRMIVGNETFIYHILENIKDDLVNGLGYSNEMRIIEHHLAGSVVIKNHKTPTPPSVTI